MSEEFKVEEGEMDADTEDFLRKVRLFLFLFIYFPFSFVMTMVADYPKSQMLKCSPRDRLRADELEAHPYFADV
jgi:hypothetical protein